MNTENLSPIVLFVYNRPEQTRKTLEYLQKNILAKDSRLYIFSDGPKGLFDAEAVREVRRIVSNVTGFKWVEIFESFINKGLADSIIDGVSFILTLHESVIVLEDDLLTSPDFLKFMNDALCFYKKDSRIWSIGSYNPIEVGTTQSVYLSRRGSSTGWGTWKSRWRRSVWDGLYHFKKREHLHKGFNQGGSDLTPMLIDCINGDIDSWAVRWNYSQYRLGMYSIVPIHSKIYNIGYDSSATNSFLNVRQSELKANPYALEHVNLDRKILEQFKKHYDLSRFKRFRLGLLRKLGLYKIYVKLARKIVKLIK